MNGRLSRLRTAALLPAVVIGVVLSLALTTQPASANGGIIRNQGAEKCLDMTDGSVSNGAQPQLWTCNGNPQQNWTIIQLGNGYFLIQNDHSGKCLSVLHNDPDAGAAVIQWTCDRSGNDNFMNWHKVTCGPPPGSRCRFQNEGNDFYMRPAFCGTDNGRKMYMNGACFGDAADLWF